MADTFCFDRYFIVTVSNGANMTDGPDGLATEFSHYGSDARILAYVSGNVNYAGYLNIVSSRNWWITDFAGAL